MPHKVFEFDSIICHYAESFVELALRLPPLQQAFFFEPFDVGKVAERGEPKKPSKSSASSHRRRVSNQAFKFTPGILDAGCQLLHGVPGSVLWLLAAQEAEGNLRNEARKRCVEGSQLIFAPNLP